jgi:hypothetical protein
VTASHGRLLGSMNNDALTSRKPLQALQYTCHRKSERSVLLDVVHATGL